MVGTYTGRSAGAAAIFAAARVTAAAAAAAAAVATAAATGSTSSCCAAVLTRSLELGRAATSAGNRQPAAEVRNGAFCISPILSAWLLTLLTSPATMHIDLCKGCSLLPQLRFSKSHEPDRTTVVCACRELRVQTAAASQASQQQQQQGGGGQAAAAEAQAAQAEAEAASLRKRLKETSGQQSHCLE